MYSHVTLQQSRAYCVKSWLHEHIEQKKKKKYLYTEAIVKDMKTIAIH